MGLANKRVSQSTPNYLTSIAETCETLLKQQPASY